MEIAKRGYKSEIVVAKEIGRSERWHEEPWGKTDRTPKKDANKKFELWGVFAEELIHKFGEIKGQAETIRRLKL